VGLFLLERNLERFQFNGRTISGAQLSSGSTVEADVYILATTPCLLPRTFSRATPDLAGQEELRYFKPLVQDGPHIQVSFPNRFTEPIKFSRARRRWWLRILSST